MPGPSSARPRLISSMADVMYTNAVYFLNQRIHRGDSPGMLNFSCVNHVYYAYASVGQDGGVFVSRIKGGGKRKGTTMLASCRTKALIRDKELTPWLCIAERRMGRRPCSGGWCPGGPGVANASQDKESSLTCRSFNRRSVIVEGVSGCGRKWTLEGKLCSFCSAARRGILPRRDR